MNNKSKGSCCGPCAVAKQLDLGDELVDKIHEGVEGEERQQLISSMCYLLMSKVVNNKRKSSNDQANPPKPLVALALPQAKRVVARKKEHKGKRTTKAAQTQTKKQKKPKAPSIRKQTQLKQPRSSTKSKAQQVQPNQNTHTTKKNVEKKVTAHMQPARPVQPSLKDVYHRIGGMPNVSKWVPTGGRKTSEKGPIIQMCKCLVHKEYPDQSNRANAKATATEIVVLPPKSHPSATVGANVNIILQRESKDKIQCQTTKEKEEPQTKQSLLSFKKVSCLHPKALTGPRRTPKGIIVGNKNTGTNPSIPGHLSKRSSNLVFSQPQYKAQSQHSQSEVKEAENYDIRFMSTDLEPLDAPVTSLSPFNNEAHQNRSHLSDDEPRRTSFFYPAHFKVKDDASYISHKPAHATAVPIKWERAETGIQAGPKALKYLLAKRKKDKLKVVSAKDKN